MGIYLIIACVVVALMRIFLLQNYVVPSGSMENTLQVSDMILAWKPGQPERGDIVVFRDDLGWLPQNYDEAPQWKKVMAFLKFVPPLDEQYLVKRLIGLEGDHVVCCDVDGNITVNGEPLDEPYLVYAMNSVALRPFEIHVPQGHMFVLGDHRDSSKDSRAMLCSTSSVDIATPKLDSVQGSVFAILRPFSRAQWFSVPETFDDVPDPGPPPAVDEAEWSCT
jgi:signal peptidase I